MFAAQPYTRPSIIYTGVDGKHMRGAPPAVVLRLIPAAMGCPRPLFASGPADSLLCDRGGILEYGNGRGERNDDYPRQRIRIEAKSNVYNRREEKRL